MTGAGQGQIMTNRTKKCCQIIDRYVRGTRQMAAFFVILGLIYHFIGYEMFILALDNLEGNFKNDREYVIKSG
jgi:hypothetical protein